MINIDESWGDTSQLLVSVMLKEGGRLWISAGAAGGSELPLRAEPYKLRVELPVALAKAMRLSARGAAELSASSESHQENFEWLRWLRWTVEVPGGTFDALGLGLPEGEAALARALEAAMGVPMFARFEVEALKGRGAGGDWASASREPGDLMRLFSALEAKALERISSSKSTGKGPQRI